MSNELFNGIRTYVTGEELPAEDVNTANEHIIRAGFRSFIAGENISVGEPVYLKDSDGKVYRADANAGSGASKIIGFAMETQTTGSLIDVQCAGIFEYPTGLSIGSLYYLSATVGQITTTPTQITVGIAISANRLLLLLESMRYVAGIGPSTNGDAATHTDTLTHNLGRKPRVFRITATKLQAGFPIAGSTGSYDGVNHTCIAWTDYDGTQQVDRSPNDGTFIAKIGDSGAFTSMQTATITSMNENTIAVLWTKTGTPDSTNYHYIWEAYA